jgi:hypothetical protein
MGTRERLRVGRLVIDALDVDLAEALGQVPAQQLEVEVGVLQDERPEGARRRSAGRVRRAQGRAGGT